MGLQSSPDVSLVLVVDDDQEVLQVTADILEALGYQVIKARRTGGGRTVAIQLRNLSVVHRYPDARYRRRGTCRDCRDMATGYSSGSHVWVRETAWRLGIPPEAI